MARIYLRMATGVIERLKSCFIAPRPSATIDFQWKDQKSQDVVRYTCALHAIPFQKGFLVRLAQVCGHAVVDSASINVRTQLCNGNGEGIKGKWQNPTRFHLPRELDDINFIRKRLGPLP
jgi:hypothetical protein